MLFRSALAFDFGFDRSVNVEVDFAELSFMQDYYKGPTFSLTFKLADHFATICAFIGSDCSDPHLANDFLDRYAATTGFADTWSAPRMCERGCGLALATEFSFRGEGELGEEIAARLSLFADERFTNELRPFIHYFT